MSKKEGPSDSGFAHVDSTAQLICSKYTDASSVVDKSKTASNQDDLSTSVVMLLSEILESLSLIPKTVTSPKDVEYALHIWPFIPRGNSGTAPKNHSSNFEIWGQAGRQWLLWWILQVVVKMIKESLLTDTRVIQYCIFCSLWYNPVRDWTHNVPASGRHYN